ncbi:MAG: putative motility protein [Campylobacterota bacterium]|nr:putative motility protein [Campylobacterota bacterium]
MDSIQAHTSVTAPVSAMKKAIDVQEEGLMKLLESTQVPTPTSQTVNSSTVTGLGQNLDIKV